MVEYGGVVYPPAGPLEDEAYDAGCEDGDAAEAEEGGGGGGVGGGGGEEVVEMEETNY